MNSDPFLIYRRTIAVLRCPVWFMIDRSDAPAAAALEARPERKLCPAKWEASSPNASTYFFTMSPTAAPESRVAAILPCRLIGRNTGPSVMPLDSNHVWNERTGHVAGFDPYGTPIFRPSPSWSVLERRIVTDRKSVV